MTMTVTMPQLGESVTEGTIARWLKQPGEKVERYEAIAEVITDKVNAEIPAPAEGVMGRHLVEEGAVVPVGAPICDIDGAEGEQGAPQPQEVAAPAAAAPAAEAPATPVVAQPAPPPAPQPQPVPVASAPPAAEPVPTEPAPPAEVPAHNGNNADVGHVTPAVRMLAREHGVDLSRLQGSGLGGRITKKDVLTFVQQQGGAPAPSASSPSMRTGATSPAPPPPPVAPAPAPTAAAPSPPAVPGTDTLVPLTPARRAIAEHMVRSRQTSPHAWTLVEVDMSAVARVRTKNRAAFRAATGVDLTFLPFVEEAVCRALREYPSLNSTWTADGIVLKRDVNLGLAVALEDNLIVPVVKGADGLNLAGLARASQDVIDRARNGRLRIDDLQGGTFTLNNAGALGTVFSQAIINQPQAAICVMDAIVKRPVVVGDAIAIRSIMNLSISFDHRINDGMQATRFLVSVKKQLEGIDESAPVI